MNEPTFGHEVLETSLLDLLGDQYNFPEQLVHGLIIRLNSLGLEISIEEVPFSHQDVDLRMPRTQFVSESPLHVPDLIVKDLTALPEDLFPNVIQQERLKNLETFLFMD